MARLACRKTGLSPQVKYFTDRSKAVLLLWNVTVTDCRLTHNEEETPLNSNGNCLGQFLGIRPWMYVDGLL